MNAAIKRTCRASTTSVNPLTSLLNSCFLSSIGKLWADGGRRDLLVDSGVYAGNTAELMLVGKEFNRDVKGFTLVVEALQVLFIAALIIKFAS
jgi:hypothetical protein